MLKTRLRAVEKRLAGLGGTAEKKVRLFAFYSGGPEPKIDPNEEVLAVKAVWDQDEKAEAEKRPC